MISSINNITFTNYTDYRTNQKKFIIPSIMPALNNFKADSVCFTGKSAPSMYSSVFEYLASEIFGRNKKFKVDGSLLSSSKISYAINQLFEEGRAFPDFKRSNVDKIKWKSYIPQDIRSFSIDKINEARTARFAQWRAILENPSNAGDAVHNPELMKKLQDNKALRLVIWDAVTSEIKDANRHIPVPLNEVALLETIKDFENIEPKARAVRCTKPSFLEIYTHRLRDNLLMEMGLSEEKAVWVKVPSIKHDQANKEKNIATLETLSCRNWCTRSSVDKAEAALEDGDFYIYLKRNGLSMWEPLVGMTTARGKIDQIQGIENNNIVPLNLVEEIKSFISSSNLKCHSGLVDEGPKARQAIMISEKLNEELPELEKTFAKAIKDSDSYAMFKYFGVPVEKGQDGLLEIGTYRPSYILNKDSGITIPYSMFGLNEDDLLKNVQVINGNLILDFPKNKLFNSLITEIPSSLEKVTGKIECSQAQYEKFGADLERLAPGRVVVHK